MNGPSIRGESGPAAGHRFKSVARSDTGPVRRLNEDRFVDLASAGLWAVADGMGGHEAGDVAAQMVADALHQAASLSDECVSPDEVCRALEQVNGRLAARGRASGTSGSTVVALTVRCDGGFTCTWVGDSRAYRIREGMLVPISRDHSFVQELVEAGLLSPAEARNHPRANVITRAIGVAEDVQLDRVEGNAEAGDLFLLCSDGLTSALDEETITRLLRDDDLDRSADRMLAAAVAAPALDNVTFVLVSVA